MIANRSNKVTYGNMSPKECELACKGDPDCIDVYYDNPNRSCQVTYREKMVNVGESTNKIWIIIGLIILALICIILYRNMSSGVQYF